jgi:hypothetical protein
VLLDMTRIWGVSDTPYHLLACARAYREIKSLRHRWSRGHAIAQSPRQDMTQTGRPYRIVNDSDRPYPSHRAWRGPEKYRHTGSLLCSSRGLGAAGGGGPEPTPPGGAQLRTCAAPHVRCSAQVYREPTRQASEAAA